MRKDVIMFARIVRYKRDHPRECAAQAGAQASASPLLPPGISPD